ncbi:hypothetical protein FHS82_002397 [Pseudochelatococcus lubricantis]|uniref:EamA family transporter n=1 Tax=Pseudochelatococcus lubricantis TaxID=1538102 RepID=A0ABX0V005_9HYPH|nr:hypothetical protein [Pseudochelatococcus lubricantis]
MMGERLPGRIGREHGSVLRSSVPGRLWLAAFVSACLWGVAFWAMDWI